MHRSMKTLRLMALLAFATVAGCGSTMNVRGGVEHGATLVGHATYEFGPAEDAPTGFGRQSVTPDVLALARKHVDEELNVRGYKKHDGGDMVVRLSNGRRLVNEELQVAGGAGDSEEFTETQGVLVVDVFDRSSQRRLYHGVAHDVVDADKVDDDQIKEAVHRILANFPAAS